MNIIKFQKQNTHLTLQDVYNKFHNIETPKCYCGDSQLFLNMNKGYLGYCSHDCKQKELKYNITNIMSILETDGLIFSSYDYRQIYKFLNITSEEVYLMKYPNSGKCIICSKQTSFINSKQGFLKTCSYLCGNKLERRKLTDEEKQIAKDKRKETNLTKYGVESNLQLIDNTGSNNISHRQDVKDKRKSTMVAKYGVEYALQNKDILQKVIDTNIERYGTEHIMQTPAGQEKFKTTMLVRYNVASAMNSAELVEKFKNSRIKNFSIRENEIGIEGYVYILKFTDTDYIKIGLTNKLNLRFKGLRKDFGDFNILHIIKTNSCRELELFLHKKYGEFRVILAEGCGKTEFFNINNIDLNDLPIHLNYEFLFNEL